MRTIDFDSRSPSEEAQHDPRPVRARAVPIPDARWPPLPRGGRPAFGPGSRERHERLAAEAGASVASIDVPTLGLDVDTVEDLAALRTALEDVRGGASHTRGLLARFGRVGGR